MLTAAAGVGAGASALWHYNRGNFLFDRKLRQEQEFAIFEWRKVQAELWREDVRDIIEMTEKKMDNYLIVSVLQLGMCAGLFACGRLEPGTPPWLLNFYLLTLGGAFTYLLMSVWLAMHAGVVAQCVSVRMLTQFVRLPVPGWSDLEGARTYAHAFEAVRAEDMLRVPFFGSLAKGEQPGAAAMPRGATGPGYREWHEDLSARGSPSPSTASSKGSARATPHADPWRLERHGDERGFYELQKVRLELRRHIRLARKAALQYQCFDAFARLSMSFGTHQLLFALAHYGFGYLMVQVGVVWPAVCIATITGCISITITYVDFSMSRCVRILGVLLVVAGQSTSCVATVLWILEGIKANDTLAWVLPVTYIANFLWLISSLRACGIVEDPATGVALPTALRAALYLDVFGWLSRSPAERCTPAARTPRRRMSEDSPEEPQREPSPAGSVAKSALARPSWIRRFLTRRGRGEETAGTAHYFPLKQRVTFQAQGSGSDEVPFAGPAGEIGHPPHHAFEATTFDRAETPESVDEDLKGELEGLRPRGVATTPAKLFRGATLMLAGLWVAAFIVPFEMLRVYLAQPAVADIYFDEVHDHGELTTESQIHVLVGTDINGLPELMGIAARPEAVLPALGEGTRLDVTWPSHSAFVPRALATDPKGERIVVADDFGLYHGSVAPSPAASPIEALGVAAAVAKPPSPSVRFAGATPCTSIEGAEIRDVSSARDGAGAFHAVVLSAPGLAIADCVAQPRGNQSSSRPWRISGDWLEMDEEVTSFAIRDGCRRGKNLSVPDCLVVGTSAGRILSMAQSNESGSVRTFVPMQLFLSSPQPMPGGSLSDVFGRATLALWYLRGALSAFDRGGRLLGEWRLPERITWMHVASGGKYIFLLGVRKIAPTEPAMSPTPPVRPLPPRKSSTTLHRSKSLVELHRFLLPGALRALVAETVPEGRDLAKQLPEL